MATPPINPEVLRSLADEGNEDALDLLAEHADATNDVEALNELLDEGSQHAGKLLTSRAVAAGDVLELQRLSDAGAEVAAAELKRILQAARRV